MISLLLYTEIFFLMNIALVYPSSYCDRNWPSLELFLPYRLHTNKNDIRYYEFEAIFLRSFMLFFPLKLSNVSLTVAIDAEQHNTPQARELYGTIGEINRRMPGGAQMSLIPESHHYRMGYDRQQLVMFWADNYTAREYVGFVDTDAAFITYVDREDLFEDGKPVVNARSGHHAVSSDGVWKWSVGSFVSLGILEPFKCMSYFPVIVKVSHLPEMREFIARYHNLTFNDAFYHNITNGVGYSQFGIMCTYLYAFKREEYKWYVHSETPQWDGKNPPPTPGQDGNVSQFTAEMNIPKPRISTHVGHRRTHMNPIPNIRKRLEMNLFLQEGICISPPFPKTEAVCNSSVRPVIVEGYYNEMHNFDYIDYSLVNSAESLKNEFNKRQARLQNCTHEWDQNEINMVMKPLASMSVTGW